MSQSRPQSESNQPNVIIEFECHNGCFFLAITNIGPQPAHEITTTFEPTFSGLHGCRQIPDQSMFDSIGFLSPGNAIRTFVDTTASYFAREEPTVIQTDVSFHNQNGRTYHNHATHTLEVYRDLPYLESETWINDHPIPTTSQCRPEQKNQIRDSIPPSMESPSRNATFELYKDREEQYRWRLVHPNGNIIADSGEGYASKQGAKRGITSVQQNASIAQIEDLSH